MSNRANTGIKGFYSTGLENDFFCKTRTLMWRTVKGVSVFINSEDIETTEK